MPGKFYNLDTDGNLGGDGSSNVIASSQKAVKTYVDGQVDVLDEKIDAIEIVDELSELQDVQLSETANGQALVYNETTGKWENKAISTDNAAWGNITGTLSDQTDLNTALSGKAPLSHTHVSADITDLTIPTKVSDLTNDAGYINDTELSEALGNYVPTSRKVAGKALTGDVTLSASDIGAQTEITSSNKLSASLISESTDKKFVTDTQINTWNSKQNAINDLADIRSGATAGSTAIQPGDNISELVNDAGYLTEADIPSVFIYKGTVPTIEDLPTTGNKKGDVWTVVENGAEYVWDSTKWEYLGQLLDLDGYATKEDLQGYVPTSRKVNNKSLTSNITLAGGDISLTNYTKGSTSGAITASDTTNTAFGKIENNLDGKQATISDLSTIRSNAQAGKNASDTISGYGDIVTRDADEFLTEHQSLEDYQKKNTAVTHTANTSVGSSIQPVYIDSDGKATATSYSVAKSVPSDAKFTDTTYTAGTGLSLSGTTINHKNSIEAGTAGSSTASSGSTLSVPYVTYDAQGHVTETGNRTHTVTGFLVEADIAGKADLSELADVALSGDYNDLSNTPTIPTVGNAEIEIQKNGTKVDSFTTNQSGNKKTINISVPTDTNDLTNGAGFLVAADIEGKQDVIDTDHKLSSDLVDDTNKTHKFVSASEKSTWNGKQDAISDLADIRSGAEAGATALQSGDNVSELTNDAGYLVASDISGKADKATTLSGYGITDAYTKTEIDGKLASGMHYKGTKASASQLPSSGNETGDLWNVEDTGANYAWNGTAWDKLSENIDLSGLVPKTTKVNGKALSGDITLTYTDVNALSASTSIPSKTSDLTNDSDFITSEDIPTNLSEFTDDLGSSPVHTHSQYLTEHQDISGKQDKIDASHKLSADLISEGTTNKLVSASEKATWSGKQDAISDLATIRSGAEAGSTALQPNDNVSELTNDAGYLVAADISGKQDKIDSTHKLDADLVDDSTSTNKFVTAANKTTWNGKQDAINDLSTIRSNATAGKSAKDAVDAMGDIVSHDADEFAEAEHTHAISDVTNLQTTLDGKQAQITSTNKLSADLLSEGTTNKLVSSTEKTTWNNKQNAISDLTTIRNNASAGAGAATTIAGYGDIVTHDADEFAEATHSHAISDVTNLQTTLDGKQASITSTNKLSADLISDGTTNKTVTSTEKTTWNNKQNAISDLSTIRSGAEAGATAVQPGDLADVATSGDYEDLTNTPTIPTKTSDLTNDEGFITGITSSDVTTALGYTPYNSTNPAGYTNNVGTITGVKMNGTSKGTSGVVDLGTVITAHQDISGKANTADLSDVAFSGNYNDLDNKPTIPTVNNATLTIQKNGTAVKTFTANASSDVTCNITVPTQPSDIGAAAATHDHTASQITDLSTTISTAIAGKADSATSLSGYGITDAYTKTEIDGMVASGMHYKGTKASASALPTTGNKVGDLWNVEDTGANYAWNGSAWDKLSENIDLSGYVPTSRTINSKALTGNITLSASDVGALPSTTSIPSKTSDLTNDSGFITSASVPTKTSDLTNDSGFVTTDTKNTAGTTNKTGAKMFLAAATEQGANPQTYSNSNCYIGTDNCLYSGGTKVLTSHQSLSGYVQTSRKVAGKALTADITLSASDVGALPDTTEIPANTSDLNNDSGFITSSALSDYQLKTTAVTHTASTAVGSTITPVYIASNGAATALSYTIAKSVPSDALFTDTTYSAGTDMSLSGTTFNHKASGITAGTTGTSSATSGSTLAIPYVTYNAQGHLTAAGTHTHTVTGFQPTNTAVKHTASTAVGNTITPVYVASDGTATALSYTIAKSVPSDAKFSDTTYTAGSGLSLSGTEFKHSNSIEAGTAGTSTATSGSTLAVPYVTYDAQGHITAKGTHTHTVTGFAAATHNHTGSNVNSLTGYAIASASAAVSESDDLLTALGKIEYKANQAASGTVTVGQLAG